jgi:NAD(P)H-dependent FMN reductase
MKILALSGSLREGSFNTRLALAASELAPPGVEVELFTGLGALPSYAPELDDPAPAPVAALRDAIRAADALLVVTPEYNGSMSGVLKNAIDWASRPRGDAALHGITVAVAGASPGQYGAIWAVNDLRRVLGIAGARVIEGEISVPRAHEVVGESGPVANPQLRQRVAALLESLVSEAAPALAA